MTPGPYLHRAYSFTPSQLDSQMTGTYTIHGGGSCLKAKNNPNIPMAAETTCTSGIMDRRA